MREPIEGTSLPLDAIEATAATQVRVKLSPETIDAYCEDIRNGAVFPPLDVYQEKGAERYILADGFHRHRAFINAEYDEVEVYIYEGGMHEALMHALGANTTHGLPRTNADKKHAVEMCLKDPELSQHTRQEIADICGVSKRMVQKMANRQAMDDPDPDTNGTEPNKTRKPTNGDKRTARPEPTQAEVEAGELREALNVIRAFPYSGKEAPERMDLSVDDAVALDYVAEWCRVALQSVMGEGE